MPRSCVLATLLITCVNSYVESQPYPMSASGSLAGQQWTKRSALQVDSFLKSVEHIFWEYVKKDAGVQEAIRYLNSCRWLKLIRELEHHSKFKKLKVLLAKNDIIDLSYKKLVPIKKIMARSNITAHSNGEVNPDFSNLMLAIEEKLDAMPFLPLYLYNIRHSEISKRIQESSTAGVIQHFLDEIMTLPVTDLILHELIAMSFNFNSVLHIMFATISRYKVIMLRGAREPSIQQIAKFMDDGTLLANLMKDAEGL